MRYRSTRQGLATSRLQASNAILDLYETRSLTRNSARPAARQPWAVRERNSVTYAAVGTQRGGPWLGSLDPRTLLMQTLQ